MSRRPHARICTSCSDNAGSNAEMDTHLQLDEYDGVDEWITEPLTPEETAIRVARNQRRADSYRRRFQHEFQVNLADTPNVRRVNDRLVEVQEHTAPGDGQEALNLQWTATDKSRADLQKQRADLDRQRADLNKQQADLDKQAAGLAQQVAEHAEQVANLADQVTELHQERREMVAVGIADHDIVDLSVGGTLFTTKRATLTQVEGSLLEAMFSGRWEQCLDRNSQGQVFLDFDADAFARILGMLRQLRLCNCTPSDMVVTHTQDPSKQQAFESLVNYLGLEEVLKVQSTASARPGQLSTALGAQQHGQTSIEQWILSGQAAQYPTTVPQSCNTPTNQAYNPSLYTQHLYQAGFGQTAASQASGLHAYSLP